MQKSELNLKRLLKHNVRLLCGVFAVIFLVAYVVIVLRSMAYFFILEFQVVAVGISIAIGTLYLLFMMFQLYLDGKKKRKLFFKEPMKSLTDQGFQIGFGKLTEWNYASSWCFQKEEAGTYGELDVDRIASEQKNYIQFRVKPSGYDRKQYQADGWKQKLGSLDGEADKKCLVFFIEESEMKKKSIEEIALWLSQRWDVR